jgi:hypothetical protein
MNPEQFFILVPYLIINIFTTGTLGPTATVWSEQGSQDFNLNKQAELKNDLIPQIFIWIW